MPIVVSAVAPHEGLASASPGGRLARSAGEAHYSYRFVLEQFRPVLEELDTVLCVDRPAEIDAIHARARASGESCVHLSFAPPQLTPLGLACPTIPVFAWEFPDIPSEAWGDDERNDWCHVFRRVGRAITHSRFGVDAVRRAMGEDFPILCCPSPVWDRFQRGAAPSDALAPRRVPISPSAFVVDTGSRGPAPEARGLSASFTVDLGQLRSERAVEQPADLQLAGVVYTSVFNPADFRKNWQRMLTSFCRAFRDTPDAVLLLKFVHWNHGYWLPLLHDTIYKQPPFRCRIAAIGGFLDDASLEAMVHATTYAISTSTGEGQCLPLMELMSSGKPAVAPRHTAMLDYLDGTNAFLVEGYLQETAYPQDPRGKLLTSAFQFESESLVRALRESHAVARSDPARYRLLSQRARSSLERHCSRRVVLDRLRAFLAPSECPA